MTADLAQQSSALRQALIDRPPGLRAHIDRVAEEATALAAYWDVDPARVELAALGHDLFRSTPPEDQLRLAAETGVPVTPEDRLNPVVLHGPVAAAVLESRFGVTDAEALAAVRDHTLGAPEMPMVAKIILLADKFEPRKRQRTPVMKQIRALARRDLDLALLCWADWKWLEERSHGWQSHPGHWAARTRWVTEHHGELALPPRLQEEAGPGGD